MRTAKVQFNLVDAYEIWRITIPDDAPEDEKELKAWLEDSENVFEWEHYDLWDGGHDDSRLYKVIEVDPQPLPKMPEWWEKVYQDLVKNNSELVEKFKEEYEGKD
jgi:hypothetical protein